jgi:hypothetical protein
MRRAPPTTSRSTCSADDDRPASGTALDAGHGLVGRERIAYDRVVFSHEESSRQAADEAIRARAQRAAEQPREQLLALQRNSGNAAVSSLVQRAPKDRPASTDAPGHTPHKPAPKKERIDIHARVLKYEVDQDMGLITIGSGPDQGVEVGMAGSLLLNNGTEYADFTIEKASGRVSSAHVHAIADQINANPDVIIKASKFAGDSQEGKEF